MGRKTLFSFVFMIPFLASGQGNISAESKIQRVMVFLHGAQIERNAQVSIPTGTSDILFEGLSPEMDEQSIQVKGEGNFTILSVKRQSNFLNEQKVNENVQKIQEEITQLNEQVDIQQNQIVILKKEEEMFAQNQSIGNGGAGLDLNKLKQALDFQKARLTQNKLQQLNSQKEIKRLEAQISKLTNQVSALRGKGKRNTSDILVKVSAKAPANGVFKITYLVRNASWYPTYDLRATDVSKPIHLVYRANVSQQSGEDWKYVKLVLSSGDPSRGGNKPELQPYQVGYRLAGSPGSGYSYSGTRGNISQVVGRVTDASDGSALPGVSVLVKGTTIGAQTNADGYYSIQVPSSDAVLQYTFIGYKRQDIQAQSSEINVNLAQDAKQLSEVVVTSLGDKYQNYKKEYKPQPAPSMPLEVQVQQSQTSVQFEIQQPYSVSTDGKQLTVAIAEHELKADYRYCAVPKLSPEAYLTAAVSGISELNLLSGEANIFFEGAFLGKTLINVQTTSDTLSISLGADKNVVLKRTQQKDQNDKAFIGSNQRATRAYLLEVFNRKSQPIKLTMEDQVPISNTSEVTVESLELSGAKLDEPTGKLKWDFQLQPNERKELRMKYQVKYPKNRPVNLE